MLCPTWREILINCRNALSLREWDAQLLPAGRLTRQVGRATVVLGEHMQLAAVDAVNRSLRKGGTPPGPRVVTDLPSF